MKKNKSETPRSTRYTKKQTAYFGILEEFERNVSEWLRAAAQEKMDRDIEEMKKSLSGPNQTIAGININILYQLGELPN